ncbi:MAG: hypothetical protein EXR79_01695 [Myxococcales bacterium]|nr:hypothetical protein [Myxococcales bacterium]
MVRADLFGNASCVAAGDCVTKKVAACDDANACTLDSCGQDKCLYPNASDLTSCGTGKSCNSGTCTASAGP